MSKVIGSSRKYGLKLTPSISASRRSRGLRRCRSSTVITGCKPCSRLLSPDLIQRCLQRGISGQVCVGHLHCAGAHPSALVGDGLGVATGRLSESCGPGVPEGMWLDEPQTCASASSLDHLTGTVRAQGITCSFPDE